MCIRDRNGTPTFSYPQTVTMYGKNYSISDGAAATFANIKLKDYITLLFDTEGNVVAAYPKRDVSADMQGIVTNVKDGVTATVALFNGLILRDIAVDADELSSMLGRAVVVAQSSDCLLYTSKGKVTDVLVEVGDEVKKGDKLVVVNPTETRQELETAQNELAEAQRSVTTAQSEVTQAQNTLNAAQKKLSKLNVTAPFTGKIIPVDVYKRQVLTADIH